jgi:F1F0 ATPase subunit 2
VNILGLKLLACLILGAAFGAAFFGALEWNVRLYSRNAATRLASLIHLTRFLVMAIVFVGFADLGAAPLFSALAGFQLVRIFAVSAKAAALEGVP